MRARIIPTIPETVMSYNLGEKAVGLEKALAPLGIRHVVIPLDKAGETVGFLAGYAGFGANGSAVCDEGSCVIFSGIGSKRLDAVLKAIRGLDIPLKAVVTAHNQSMSVGELIGELEREHRAINGGIAKL